MFKRDYIYRDPVGTLGQRPRDFYAPEDAVDDEWEKDEAWIQQRQKEWDENYAKLTRWQKFRRALGLY